jgi:hypothetical protein
MSRQLQTLYEKARRETAKLFRFDVKRLTPEQTTRLDLATALRIGIDDMQGRIVRGETVDVMKMLSASEALAKLLPPEVLASPPAGDDVDPRKVLFDEYMQMRRRGELAVELITRQRAKRDSDSSENQVAKLQARIAELEAALAERSAAPKDDVPEVVEVVKNVVPMPKPKPAVAKPAPSFDYADAARYVRPDGSISPAPLGGGGRKY